MKKLCILPLQYIWNIIIFFQIINCDVKKNFMTYIIDSNKIIVFTILSDAYDTLKIVILL